MLWTTSIIIAIGALFQLVVAAPGAGELHKRVIATANCAQDNLYRSFIDPKSSASASAFCSTYIQATVTTATTSTATVTVEAAKRGIEEKRALAATTQYPASRLSSACSCILTATPSAATVYSTTLTTIITVTTSGTSTTTSSESASSIATSTTSSSASPSSAPTSCTAPLPIVQNGNFETGNLDPWSIHSVSPPSTPWYMYRVYETDPDNSTYAFRVQDSLASSYFNVQLGQLLTVCAGQEYNFSARYFMANARMAQMSMDVLLDRQILRGRQIYTSPRYVDLRGSFMASEDYLAMTVSFSTAEKFLSATWGLDNVVITPA